MGSRLATETPKRIATQTLLREIDAALAWLNESRAGVRSWETVAFCSVSFLLVGYLAWNVVRRGR